MPAETGDVTILVRAAGERTEQLCADLLIGRGVSISQVEFVRERPFTAALRRSFEIGIERRRRWTLCVDADVLCRPDAVVTMLEHAEAQPAEVFETQGLAIDKFFGGARMAAYHLYRTSLLPKALGLVPSEGEAIRPENRTLEAMAAAGHPWRAVPWVAGIHDHEQWYRDVFRKAFVHAHKHQHLTEPLVEIWRDGAAGDIDFRVALLGFAAGIRHHAAIRLDVEAVEYETSFAELGIDEKPPLTALVDVEKMIETWREPPAYRDRLAYLVGLPSLESRKIDPPARRLRQRIAEYGIVRVVPYLAGRLLERLGRRLASMARPRQ